MNNAKTFGTKTFTVGEMVSENSLRGRIGRVIAVSDEGVRVARRNSFEEFTVAASLIRCGGLDHFTPIFG